MDDAPMSREAAAPELMEAAAPTPERAPFDQTPPDAVGLTSAPDPADRAAMADDDPVLAPLWAAASEGRDRPDALPEAPGSWPAPVGSPAPYAEGAGVAPTPEPRTQPSAASRAMGRIVEEIVAWFKTLASAAVYATLIVTFGFQVARVEGQSMAPTLADQDRLIVNKLVYRFGAPRRGDIVMLYYPLNPDKSFVKRVIAEEGDQVRVVDGRVYVNEVPMSDDFVPPEYRSHDDWGPQVIPEGYYFVMGDHRNNSSDSRHWGFVPKKYIIGKVQVRWWPLPEARIF
jgi:signal peptidase I